MDASYKHPVVAVVGPTATGKTALGVALAEQFGGEVISADSMQIYKGLDVGTAKVTPEETHGIPHHGVDILEPDALFRYVSALNKAAEGERPQVLFCDEDMFQKTGEWGQPVFKTQLNVDLLYSHNCVTHFLMVEKALIDHIGTSPEDVAGAQDYDLTLRCLAAGSISLAPKRDLHRSKCR